MTRLGIRHEVVLRSGLQVTEFMSPAARARAASAVRASVERGDWRDEEPEALVGAVGPVAEDAGRVSCRGCGRVLASGQAECVCGAAVRGAAA